MIEPYDEMRSDFMLIENEDEATYCIDKYGIALSKKYLPRKYLYLTKESK